MGGAEDYAGRAPVTADVQRELAVHRVLYDLIVDHPMWIDGKGRGLDYSPERESLIGDFLDSAVEVLAPVIADAEKRAAAGALREAADAMSWPDSQNCGPALHARAAALDPLGAAEGAGR